MSLKGKIEELNNTAQYILKIIYNWKTKNEID